MPNENRYGYGRQQANRIDREDVVRYSEPSGTTEEAVIKEIMDGVEAAIASYFGFSGASLIGHLMTGATTQTDYPTKAELITEITELLKLFHEVLGTFNTLANFQSSGVIPATYTMAGMGGTRTIAYGEMADLIEWWDAMCSSGEGPYCNYMSSTWVTNLCNLWGNNLSANDSTYPSAVTPKNFMGYGGDMVQFATDFYNWMQDLAAGAGTGAIYVSDV